MIGRTNAGGALAKAFAAIAAAYPAGSACTCTNGTKTLKAKDTSGQVLFLIPSAGRWTVSYRADGKSDSRELEITSYGQLEKVSFRLPAEYREVEYIDCTGTQCLIVPGLPTANAELTWDVYYDPLYYKDGKKSCKIGVWGGEEKTAFGFQMNTDVGLNLQAFYGTAWAKKTLLNAPMDSEGWHTVTHSFVEGFIAVDDLKETVTVSNFVFAANAVNMGLGVLGVFYQGWDGAKPKSTFMRCREFIWKESGAEHMHLIPCYRIADKVAGMYDLVNDVFYTNSGTGTFVVGGDVQ